MTVNKSDLTQEYWYTLCQEILNDAGISINGNKPFDIQVKNQQFFKRVLLEGSLGLGESYMDGWWECGRPDIFIERLLSVDAESRVDGSIKNIIRGAVSRLVNLQSRKRAWIVGKEHYDLGNDLFCLMLDPWMQYSCGYWKEANNLKDAQKDKLRLICDKLQLEKGMTLLDIGCGWGGLAAYAAQYCGVKVTGVTISAEQQKMAEQCCSGLDVEIRLQDYRDLNMQFDRIVSVGMFEHVGPKNYDTYFRVVNNNLKADGIFLLHTIGSNKSVHNVDPWINKYIFPNGTLPSLQQIAAASERYFVTEDVHNFGPDYDRTLMAWYDNFCASWELMEERYSERFRRMFTYYLNACAGAFRARHIQLWQMVFTRGTEGGLRVPR
ncbi:TPA: cyclopropane fatty acyl phospholipid synthase [Salmonella enterica subsp. enterica serovar Welikade]|nr:cyclopropane fatty acyl phospholipid synthase [Salmonella enterica subsp. enterica serovar Welikade]